MNKGPGPLFTPSQRSCASSASTRAAKLPQRQSASDWRGRTELLNRNARYGAAGSPLASGHANARSSSERARIPRDQSVTGRRAGGTEDVESVAGGDRDQPRNVRGLCKRRWQDALGRRLADLVQEALELERREPD